MFGRDEIERIGLTWYQNLVKSQNQAADSSAQAEYVLLLFLGVSFRIFRVRSQGLGVVVCTPAVGPESKKSAESEGKFYCGPDQFP